MKQFRYKYGDRPLEGYTIQRAAGYGGFGEVYYAISDSGRQVALKEIQNYEQIELRGISQCMNLKSPHLVSIFDVKYNKQNRPFVIMEYVSGVSLRDLLKESPNGLGAQKAAFFLREIAKGLSFLHECGIVHRDLKPSNIFYENGYVKIGDYGLTKAISASQHSGQTITVGTVHYMAPEIGAGCYDRSIDIYALGILLYEMLTGQVPFFGASPGEILMKHMSATPELDNIEEPFARVISKALAKDPADRYQTVQEMVEDVFGSENIRNSVSQFSPEALSVIAQRVAEKAKLNVPPGQSAKSEGKTADAWEHLGQRIGKLGDRIAQKVNSRIGVVPAGTSKGIVDPIDRKQRQTLALVTMTVIALGAGLLQGTGGAGVFYGSLVTFLMIAAASKTILLCKWNWLANLEKESTWLRRFATGGLAALIATLAGVLFCQLFVVSDFGNQGLWIWLSLTVVLSFTDWWKITSPQRPKRVSLEHALLLGLFGIIAAALLQINPVIIISVLAGTSLVVQIASGFAVNDNVAAAVAGFGKTHWGKRKWQRNGIRADRQVWPYARLLWIIGCILTLGFGIMMLVAAGIGQFHHNDEYAIAVSCGVCALMVSIFCFFKSFGRRFTSWYRYLIKPALLLICLMTIVTASICMGNMSLHNEEFLFALFFIIFPAILFLVIAFIPSRIFETPTQVYAAAVPQVSPFKRVWALLLSGGIFFGLCGLHRFYVGKIGTGILWLLTWGLFGFGQFIDVIMIILGQFKDCYGRRLTIWENTGEPKDIAYANEAAQAQNNAVGFTDKTQSQDSEKDADDQHAGDSSARIIMMPSAFQDFHPFGFLLSSIGYIFLLVAILVGLAIALHLPAMVAAGLPDPSLAKELDKLFGYTGWPQLLEHIGIAVVTILLVLAVIFIIIARRKSGPLHIIRAVLGLLGLLAALLFLSEGLPRYPQEVIDMLNSDQLGPALEKLLKSTGEDEAVMALILVVVSVIILAWPPRQKQPVFRTVAQNQEVMS